MTQESAARKSWLVAFLIIACFGLIVSLSTPVTAFSQDDPVAAASNT